MDPSADTTAVKVGERPTRFRYVIAGLVLLIAVVNYADRGALAFASQQIIKEYGLNAASWGAVLGYFGYGFMLGGVIGGFLSDRWGPKRVQIVAGIGWSVFEAATAFAGEIGLAVFGGSALAGFAVIRILFGLAEGPTFSVLNKSISGWASPRERASMIALALASAPLGGALAAPVSVSLLVLTGSWRMMFLILGAFSLAVVALFGLLYTNRPADNRFVNAAELASLPDVGADAGSAGRSGTASSEKLFTGKLFLNAIGFFAYLYINTLILTWTPKYLQDHFHVSLSSMSYLGVIPWVGACVTMVLGGFISDRILAKTGNMRLARSGFAAGSLLLVGLLFGSVIGAQSVATALVLIMAANALNALINSVFWAIILDNSPPALVGRRSGITLFIASSSTIIAPTVTGMLVQSFGYDGMFLAGGAVSLVGALAMISIRLRPALLQEPRVPETGVIGG
jgi:sugar phosphate permease